MIVFWAPKGKFCYQVMPLCLKMSGLHTNSHNKDLQGKAWRYDEMLHPRLDSQVAPKNRLLEHLEVVFE